MENSTYTTNDDQEPEPEYVQAELVEMSPAAPWEWREVRPVQPRRRWKLPLILFVATCLSTFVVAIPENMSVAKDGLFTLLLAGLSYSVPVMTILLCHEMGHFLQARRYGVYCSFPFFIPVPIPPFGTMGAVIAMEPRIGHRRALFDIGITGPLAGLVPTIIFLILGLQRSKFVPYSGVGGDLFGDPLLFEFLTYWIKGPIPPGHVLLANPMAFAGWVGLFITSLNLFPIGQLDGGHVLYALLRRKAHKVATAVLFTALFLVIWKWEYLKNWTLMLILLFIMGPIHPPTADDDEPLGFFRYLLGWLTLAFIFIGFTPVPMM